VNASINGSPSNVVSANYQGGQVVIVPNQALMCPVQNVTEITVQLTINDLFGPGCECTGETPIVINKTFTAGDIPNCTGSC
jgi:hypothetical protein